MRRLLGEDTFSDLDLRATLLGNEIFLGQNKQINSSGFTQNIKRGNSLLNYQVLSDSITLHIQNMQSKAKFTLKIQVIP